MKTITAKPITVENFAKYGEIQNLLNPSTFGFGAGSSSAFYPDTISFHLNPLQPASICMCQVKKRDEVIEMVEYHDMTCEGVLPLDADIVVFAGLGMPQMPGLEIEAFIVPAGTMIKYRAGVLHGTQFVVGKESANIIVLLPERTFATDMHGHKLEEKDRVRIAIEGR